VTPTSYTIDVSVVMSSEETSGQLQFDNSKIPGYTAMYDLINLNSQGKAIYELPSDVISGSIIGSDTVQIIASNHNSGPNFDDVSPDIS